MNHLLFLSAFLLSMNPWVGARTADSALLGEMELSARLNKNPWFSWESGAWVSATISNPATSFEVRQTLIKTDRKSYTLAQKSDDMVPQDLERPYAYGGFAHTSPDAIASGEEMIPYMGRGRECQMWSATYEDGGSQTTETVWVSDDFDVPLKIKVKTSSFELELNLESRRDFVRVGTKTLKCSKYKGVVNDRGKQLETFQWRSPDVPGGVVKNVTEIKHDGIKGEHVYLVTEFDGQKK